MGGESVVLSGRLQRDSSSQPVSVSRPAAGSAPFSPVASPLMSWAHYHALSWRDLAWLSR